MLKSMMSVVQIGFFIVLMIGYGLTLEDANCERTYLSEEQILIDSSTTNLRFNNTVIEWTSEFDNEYQSIELHLKEVEHIVEVETSGSNVIYFSMIYSMDGKEWTIYPKLIRTARTPHHFRPVLSTKYLKIIPQSYIGNISLRLQFTICVDQNSDELK